MITHIKAAGKEYHIVIVFIFHKEAVFIFIILSIIFNLALPKLPVYLILELHAYFSTYIALQF